MPFLSWSFLSFFFCVCHILPEFLSKEEKQVMALLLGGKLQSVINPIHILLAILLFGDLTSPEHNKDYLKVQVPPPVAFRDVLTHGCDNASVSM